MLDLYYYCGAWPESRWPADQVTMGLPFFQPF